MLSLVVLVLLLLALCVIHALYQMKQGRLAETQASEADSILPGKDPQQVRKLWDCRSLSCEAEEDDRKNGRDRLDKES